MKQTSFVNAPQLHRGRFARTRNSQRPNTAKKNAITGLGHFLSWLMEFLLFGICQFLVMAHRRVSFNPQNRPLESSLRGKMHFQSWHQVIKWVWWHFDISWSHEIEMLESQFRRHVRQLVTKTFTAPKYFLPRWNISRINQLSISPTGTLWGWPAGSSSCCCPASTTSSFPPCRQWPRPTWGSTSLACSLHAATRRGRKSLRQPSLSWSKSRSRWRPSPWHRDHPSYEHNLKVVIKVGNLTRSGSTFQDGSVAWWTNGLDGSDGSALKWKFVINLVFFTHWKWDHFNLASQSDCIEP